MAQVLQCFGCGDELSRPGDRRALDVPAGKEVLDLWTMLLENEEEQTCADVDINSIVNGSDKNRLPKMCRKCFGRYNSFHEAQVIIRKNLLKAAESLRLFSSSPVELLPPATKSAKLWRRHSSDGGSQSTQSPEISVCQFIHNNYRRRS